MRLLTRLENGQLGLTQDLVGDDKIPPYAILSHTWQDNQEVTLDELTSKSAQNKEGYQKILFCARQAKRDGLDYFWMDTCCINKASSAELSEAINSMYKWYHNAAKCYVYLSDVSSSSFDSPCTVFRQSRWFTRGWTLQELLAPASVEFFSKEGVLLGDKRCFEKEIAETTSIAVEALQGQSLSHFSIEERMKWANGRKTKREEDEAYSLLGILDIRMSLLYGEGRESAFKRLRKELHYYSTDADEAKSARNVHWVVPRTVNSFFTGRTELIRRMQDVFCIDGDNHTSQQKRLVVTGIGGQGKSEVCLRVVNLMREDFWGVFWVDVSSYSTAKNGFTTVAKTLGSPSDTVDQTLQALASTKRRWLLILDNADDPNFDYATYIPSGAHGAVIMTSRIRQCSRYSNADPIVLEGLDLSDSTQLLLKVAQLPEKLWTAHTAYAQDIVQLLGSHTLALIQAGAYVAEGYCQLHQYPEKYHQQRQRLLKHHLEQEQSRYQNVYATFEASADVLEHAKGEPGRDALDLLAILSVLHFSVFPLRIFEDAWKGAQQFLQNERSDTKKSQFPRLFRRSWISGRRLLYAGRSATDEIDALGQQHVSQFPKFMDPQAREWDDYRLKRASALLISLSLVKSHQLDGIDGLSMHSLVHTWAKDRLNQRQQQQVWVSVGCLLASLREQFELWRTYQTELRPHLQSFVLPCNTIFLYGPQNVVLPVVLRCGWMLNTMREDDRLELLLQVIYQELRISTSKPSPEYLSVWDLAARNLKHTGNTREAVVLLQHVVEARKTLLEESHPLQLDSQHELAAAYWANGQRKEAETLLEYLIEVETTMPKEMYPVQLVSHYTLVGSYLVRGRIREAVALLQHVVKLKAIVLCQTDSIQLVSQHATESPTKEAVALLQHIVEMEKTIMKEDQPSLLRWQHALSNAYLVDGQTKEAVTLIEHVVKVREGVLKETHPERLSSQYRLALTYLADGRPKDTVALLQHVVKIRKTTLKETHPDLLVSQYALAVAYWADEQGKKAITLLQHVLTLSGATMIDDHSLRLQSRSLLKKILYFQKLQLEFIS